MKRRSILVGAAASAVGGLLPQQLTIQVFEDFLRKVRRDKIAFHGLNLPNPRKVPIGPGAVIDDNITFARSS